MTDFDKGVQAAWDQCEQERIAAYRTGNRRGKLWAQGQAALWIFIGWLIGMITAPMIYLWVFFK
jgi:hypothetical protein